MYLTYDEYQTMGGTADAEAFTQLCAAACGRIDRLTHGRLRGLEPVPEEVKAAAFEVMRLNQSFGAEEGRMTAFTNDRMSVSYAVPDGAQQEARLNGAVFDALWGLKCADGKTSVLYAGVGA